MIKMHYGKYLTKTCQLCSKEYTWKCSEPDIVSGIALPGFDNNNFAHIEYVQVCHDCLHNIGKIIFDKYGGKLCGS